MNLEVRFSYHVKHNSHREICSLLTVHLLSVNGSREDRGRVPSSAGVLWSLGGVSSPTCRQPFWRPEEQSGLCSNDHVLVSLCFLLELNANAVVFNV